MSMWKLHLSLIIILALLLEAFIWIVKPMINVRFEPYFKVRSIDTVKYSRDLAKEMLDDPSFDAVIKQQVSEIAETGASHIGLDTPYDEKFLAFLKRWVKASRKHNLKIWYRGNFAGWESWFDYPKIDRSTHLQLTQKFIKDHPDLFLDGDIFTPCPECENGGPGDPRQNGDVEGFRKFLVEEYVMTQETFNSLGIKVITNYASMNFDVARLVMDRPTTRALGQVVTIDHYVKTPEQLVTDTKDLAAQTDGKIILGEFGAPINDIHGSLSEDEQADWILNSLDQLSKMPEVIGINYWTNVGGSTQLWTRDGHPKRAVDIIKQYYAAKRKVS